MFDWITLPEAWVGRQAAECERAVVLDEGRVLQTGATAAVYQRVIDSEQRL